MNVEGGVVEYVFCDVASQAAKPRWHFSSLFQKRKLEDSLLMINE